jgi:uncharacterized protein YcgL (UPF0745 family)
VIATIVNEFEKLPSAIMSKFDIPDFVMVVALYVMRNHYQSITANAEIAYYVIKYVINFCE